LQDPDGLGLVIGLSKKSTNPEKKQVVFIRALQRRANGSQSEAVKNGEMMPQDVVEAVNDVDVGTNLSVLTDEINKVEIGGPIKFRLSRRMKDEDRRVKANADKKLARKLDIQLHMIFNMIDTDKSGKLSLAEIDAAGKQVFTDKLGLHLPASVIKNGFASLEQFSEVGDGQIDYEEFRGVIYSKELALSSRKTRHAKYAVLFKKLDKDGSRSIDKEEFVGANDLLKQLFGENSDAIKEQFESGDTNADGKISFEEFADVAEDFYERHTHPDGYEALEEIKRFNFDEAEELIQDHYDEDHTEETATVDVSAVTSIVVTKASEDDSVEAEKAAPAEEDEVQAALRQEAETKHAEIAARKEAEAQQKHKEELAAQKKKKAEDDKKKAAEKERKRQAAQEAEEKKATEAVVPAKAGCCVIA
jgi:Ca2+-binding EF-hand superfamily protein